MARLTKILFRRDTAANWVSVNPILDSGEPAFDTTNRILKIGDGSTAWASLPVVIVGGPWMDFQSASYYTTQGAPQVGAGLSATANVTYYTPFYVNKPTTFDRIACVTGSSFSGTATMRLGIYNSGSAQNKPSTVVLDAGTVSCTAASTAYAITINETLQAGFYYLAGNTQTAATTNVFTATSQANTYFNPPLANATTTSFNLGWSESGVTGAFATANASQFGTPLSIRVRVA